jgi:AcrR family transcriptional regulator
LDIVPQPVDNGAAIRDNLSERSVRIGDGMTPKANGRKRIPTLVKDPELVEARRTQIVEAAVKLFSHKGFHETTTREIQRETGLSTGTLYEYIQSKEDVLYLVCEAIHNEMEGRMRLAVREGGTARDTLVHAIEGYLRACDKMQDSILLVYRETSSLKPASLKFVLQNEQRITSIFESILRQGLDDGSLKLGGGNALALMAHNIAVIGHMWAFRRWFLRERFKLNEYIALQTSLLLSELSTDIVRPANGRTKKPQHLRSKAQ